MEITFVRHAETKNNVSGVIQGPNDGHINENGKGQIVRVCDQLKGEKFDVFFSSDIPRCKTTAEGINKEQGMEIRFTELIREKYNGDWVGKHFKDVNWDELEGNFETRKVRNGESLIDVRARARKFMNDVLDEFGKTNKRILVVSHGAFLKILIGDLLGLDLKSSIFNLNVSHCSPIRVKFRSVVFENKEHDNVPAVYL